MIGSQKFRMNFLVAGLAIAFVCGPTAPAQTGTEDPNVQKAKDILLKGVASGNPDTRSLAVMSASLIGDRSEVLTKLYSMLETDKDVPTRITIISTLGSFNNPAVVPAYKKRSRIRCLRSSWRRRWRSLVSSSQMGKPFSWMHWRESKRQPPVS